MKKQYHNTAFGFIIFGFLMGMLIGWYFMLKSFPKEIQEGYQHYNAISLREHTISTDGKVYKCIDVTGEMEVPHD